MSETFNAQPSILNYFNAPETCYLGKRVFKKLFYKNAALSAADKKALQDDVDTIVWQYTFKPATIPIQPYVDEQREYLEVALLQIDLKRDRRHNRLAEIIHRAIPYPLILVFHVEGKRLMSLAHKRFSQADKKTIVAENFQATGWLDVNNSTEPQASFLQSLDIAGWPHTHFFAFYNAAMERVLALAAAPHRERFSLERPPGLTFAEQVRILKEIETVEQEKAELQRKIKQEKNLGTQVQLNIQIKQLRDRMTVLKNKL